MKRITSRTFASVVVAATVMAVGALFVNAGAGRADSGASKAPNASGAAPAIPDRPDDLRFPPLQFKPPDPAAYRVKLASGIPAYLVPDHTIPLVNIVVIMRVGSDLDPVGEEGLADMTTSLLTKSGAGAKTAETLEERVAFLGAQLESGTGAGRGMFGFGGVPIGSTESRISVNLLSKDVDEGLALLTSCLRDCAFQDSRVELRRQQDLQDIGTRNDDSRTIEDYEWGYLMEGPAHWSNRYTTEASLKAITRADMIAFQHRFMGPKNFVIAVSGDFERGAMIKKLDAAFARWPVPGENPGPPVPPSEPARSGWFVVDKEVNQTRVSIGVRALDRYDPDFYAAQIMNYIMGGGGFSSRLVNSIRSDEGLAYHVSSSIDGGVYYPDPWRIDFETKARSTARATELAVNEIRRMAEEPVSAQELDMAKKSFIEGFPARFPSAGAIAGTLAADEVTGRYQRDPKSLAEYTHRVDAVTAADVQRVAKRLLDPAKMTFLFVGSASEMALTDGKHDVTLVKLAGHDLSKVPLRDPLTMKELGTGD